MRSSRAGAASSFLVILLLFVGLALARLAADRVWEDARVYLTAGERFLDGAALYRASDGTMPFKYAPPVALLFAPLSLLPRVVGSVVWNLACLLAFAAAGRRWLTWLRIESAAAVWAATLSLATSFYLELHFGQCDLLLLALATASVACALSRRPVLAGVLVTLMLLIKPPMAMLLLPLSMFSTSRLRLLASGVLTLALLTFVVGLRYGFVGALTQYAQWRDVLAATSPPWVLLYNSQSLVAVVIELLGSGAPATMADTLVPQLLATSVVTAALLRLRHRPFELVAGCLLASALLSPLAWRANFVLGWPALLVVFSRPRLVTKVGLAAALALQVALVDGVLSVAANRALLLERPFAWLGVAALAALVLEHGAPVVRLGCAASKALKKAATAAVAES